MTAAILACLLALVALGAAERLARDRAWRAVPVRVHVNGSRGKSTVTRLVWSALVRAGVPAVGKTTGTAARLLLPDGTERPIARRAPASIREQLELMRTAKRLGARAVVVECMALDPELQWVSERQMIKATVGVITNVRLDHAEVMGGSLAEIAASLANTIPRSAVAVSGDSRFNPLFGARAGRLGTRLVSTEETGRLVADWRSRRTSLAQPARSDLPDWLAEDFATALAVTRELGIDDRTAMSGFLLAPPDPGAARAGTMAVRDGRASWIDATAANDPDSLAMVAGSLDGAWTAAGTLAVYNHRADRGPRLASFARHSLVVAGAARLIVTGERPPWTLRRALERARGGRRSDYVPRRTLAGVLHRQPAGTRVVFCGNTRGLDIARLMEEAPLND